MKTKTFFQTGKTNYPKGFSLIEIMVVIVIIAILTSLAAVSYRSYIVKARRTAAQEELMQYQQKMEEYFSLNHRYDAKGNCAVFPNGSEASAFYTYSCTLQSGYRLAATATGSQASDDKECEVMYLYRNGTRGSIPHEGTSEIGNACW